MKKLNLSKARSVTNNFVFLMQEINTGVLPYFREITLEVLSQEPVGAFIVRESTTKSGCYALSLRVPKEYHPRGIAHYLIIRTNKGYKIKVRRISFGALHSVKGDDVANEKLISN